MKPDLRKRECYNRGVQSHNQPVQENKRMPQLANRVALVTGAGRGIGRAIALAFAAEGAKVALTARTVAELDKVVGEIHAAGGTALALPADLSDRSVPSKVVAEVQRS